MWGSIRTRFARTSATTTSSRRSWRRPRPRSSWVCSACRPCRSATSCSGATTAWTRRRRRSGSRPAEAVLEELDLVDETVMLGEHELAILRPRDGEALLDEDAFATHDEYLPYWVELWPSGMALARAIHGRALRGARVIELGCGLALPSIAAALAGGRVLATDWSAHAVAVATENARRNGVSIDADVVSWYAPDELVEAAPWDLVLAADVLYEARNVPVL